MASSLLYYLSELQEVYRIKICHNKLNNYIDEKLKKYENHLSLRIYHLIALLSSIESNNDGEVDIFELLVKTILLADEAPADSIANLLISVNSDNSYLLDRMAISESAAFLRDFLKKDEILLSLKNH